jgi:hypothetical protein
MAEFYNVRRYTVKRYISSRAVVPTRARLAVRQVVREALPDSRRGCPVGGDGEHRVDRLGDVEHRPVTDPEVIAGHVAALRREDQVGDLGVCYRLAPSLHHPHPTWDLIGAFVDRADDGEGSRHMDVQKHTEVGEQICDIYGVASAALPDVPPRRDLGVARSGPAHMVTLSVENSSSGDDPPDPVVSRVEYHRRAGGKRSIVDGDPALGDNAADVSLDKRQGQFVHGIGGGIERTEGADAGVDQAQNGVGIGRCGLERIDVVVDRKSSLGLEFGTLGFFRLDIGLRRWVLGPRDRAALAWRWTTWNAGLGVRKVERIEQGQRV